MYHETCKWSKFELWPRFFEELGSKDEAEVWVGIWLCLLMKSDFGFNVCLFCIRLK